MWYWWISWLRLTAVCCGVQFSTPDSVARYDLDWEIGCQERHYDYVRLRYIWITLSKHTFGLLDPVLCAQIILEWLNTFDHKQFFRFLRACKVRISTASVYIWRKFSDKIINGFSIVRKSKVCSSSALCYQYILWLDHRGLVFVLSESRKSWMNQTIF